MECNREEAVRARKIALKKLEKGDFSGAHRVALQAQRLYPELENLSQLLTVCRVYCAAETKINGQLDWYGILQVQAAADDTVIRKQYDELAFWLHPSKNTVPGAEAAFKLVSEAHMILSDHVKRSHYDIKRQTAELPDITPGKRSWARHVPPYDCAIVFWTVCPHCKKRFVYYQRNFMAICDDCGKSFFAFKLHEQAVPSRFLSVAPDNSQVSPKMVSCQQHGVPDQPIQHTELHSTGGSVAAKTIEDSLCTEQHITWPRISGVHGKGSSETRSNGVQFSAVNQSRPSSPSADKGATGSMMLVTTASDVVVNQNFGREDPSVVPDAAGSRNLQMLGKRKHDDCADRSHRRDSCINKRRSKDDSLFDANSIADKMYNDDVADANTQAAKHVSDTIDSQGEENITHEGSQQKYKEEATDTANQTHGNPGTAYECTGSIRRRDSCKNDRQRKDNLLADANSIDDKVCSNNAGFSENQAAEPVPCTLDSQDEGNATQEGSHQKYKKDGLDIANQMRFNPLITCECPDFFDFGRLREVNRIAVNQVSAIYDDHDSLPNYAQINHIDAYNNNVQLTLLEHNTTNVHDAAALPCDLTTVFPSITLDSFIGLNKKNVTEFVGVTYPEFYNFNEDRSCEKFECGQIWALYSSTDTFPNHYGWINKVEKEPFKVHLTWLEACPQGVDKHWMDQGIPVSCGKFVIQSSTTEHCETCAFSHLVVSRWEIGTRQQINIFPKVGEVWAIYMNWAPDWVPSSKDRPANYAIGWIKMCTEAITLFAFLTKVNGHLSVFKHDVLKRPLEIPREENLRFSHRIPSFRLTKDNGGKLWGFYELDPAAVPDGLL